MVDLRVTYLEMTAPPQGEPLAAPRTGLTIDREKLDREPNLALYRAVGTPWQWDQRLRLAADARAYSDQVESRDRNTRERPISALAFESTTGASNAFPTERRVRRE